jgi:DivIVA domain-containing protein
LRLTPLDIRKHRFSTRMRGLDASEVEAFLRLISEDYEDMIRERRAPRQGQASGPRSRSVFERKSFKYASQHSI